MALAILPPREPDKAAVQLFMQQLGVGNDIASKLAMELSSLEEVAYAPMEELLETHVEESLLKTLRTKAKLVLARGT
jgi:hypothetical protein